MSAQGRLPLERTKADLSRGAKLEGVLDRVTFANEETSWSVVKMAVEGRREPVTAVGNLLGITPGEYVILHGQWVHDKRFGEQFKVDTYESVVPATLAGIERYLGSGLVRGVGKVMAGRLVERFGLATLDVIDQHPERLFEVEGIGRVRKEQIEKAWNEQRAIRDVMVFLQGHGVSTSHAVKIFKRYGEKAIALVRQNPYRLASDIFGIGFVTADAIAKSLGVLPDSAERIRAGLLHVLGELADEGHMAARQPELVERAAALLGVDAPRVESELPSLDQDEQIVLSQTPEGETAVYLAALFAAEVETAERLARLLAAPKAAIDIDVNRAIEWFERSQGLTLAAEQRRAIELAIREKVLVITGGPGTGKTTLINGVIRILEKKGQHILLAAPTGRAAKRMTEATGHEAKTIHRLLEWTPKSKAFARDPEHPLDADLLIVDEASMLDALLSCSLLRAMPPKAKLVLVGDVDQLPSVGPGSVLSDLIRSGAIPVVELAHIFRQAEASRIVQSAHLVNRGELPILSRDEGSDFFFLEKREPEEILATIKELVSVRIPKRFQFDAVRDIQVLTPMHKGALGAATLNSELQALLNPSGPSIVRGARVLRVGDKVMQVRNNYDLDVYNGDIGRITAIDENERTVTSSFDGREVVHDEAAVDELVLSYACSIHKAQGSEYPCVVVPLHTQHFLMLRRNLLYTAITRGRKLVVIVGSKRALVTAVENTETVKRVTGLSWRLAQAVRRVAGSPPR